MSRLLTILTVTLLLFLLGGYLIFQIFVPEPTILQSAPSPDGKYVAYVFESNGGATTGFIYHVSVLAKGKNLGKGTGNVYINNGIPPNNIEWLSNYELYVDDYQSINTAKQKHSIYGITVKYHSLEQSPTKSDTD